MFPKPVKKVALVASKEEGFGNWFWKGYVSYVSDTHA